MTKYQAKPSTINIITQEDGLITAECNTHTVTDVKPSELEYIYMPYAGEDQLQVTVTGDNDQVIQDVIQGLKDGTRLAELLNHDHPILSNLFKNMLNYDPDTDKRVNCLRGVLNPSTPVIFIGAGPSLTNSLDFLREAREKNTHILIAGGSANRILDNHKIYPHFALAFDPHESEYGAIGNLSQKYTENVNLITTYGLNSKVYNLPWMTRYVTGSGTFKELSKYLEPELDLIEEGCSGVATMFPNVLRYLGSTNAIMVGVDLSYGEGNRLYADSEGSDTFGEMVTVKTPTSEYTTKQIWINEAQDIIKTFKADGVSVTVLGESLFSTMCGKREYKGSKRNLGMFEISEDAPRNVKTLRRRLLEIKEDLNKVKKGVIPKEIEVKPVYLTLLRSWDLVQQFRETRGCGYNTHLIQAVVDNIIKQIG